MAESFQKKESIKKNISRKKLKASKKEERKANNNKGKGFESMIAYVDANGNLSATPPENRLIQRAPAIKPDVQLR
jgi:hypothetical protein